MAGLGPHLARLAERVGGHCLYKDSGHILLVKLTRVEVREGEVFLTLKPLPAPGLPATLTRSFRIGGQAEYMTFTPRHIGSTLFNHWLLTQPRDVRAIVRLAADVPGTDTLLKAIREAMRPARRTAGRAA